MPKINENSLSSNMITTSSDDFFWLVSFSPHKMLCNGQMNMEFSCNKLDEGTEGNQFLYDGSY